MFMKKYPTDKEIYNQILKENSKRGFGILSAYTKLAPFGQSEITLVGNNYKLFLFQINPKNIPHDKEAQKLKGFVYSETEKIGIKEVRKVIKKYLPKMYSELIKTKLYLLNIRMIDPVAEYWSEIEEAVMKKHHISLEKFLENKKSINR